MATFKKIKEKVSLKFKGSKCSNPFPLADLPDLVLLIVAKQLSNDDARNLSLTCKRFQGILPIYKYPRVVEVPNINERGPNDGNFVPTEFFRCPSLEAKVEKIDMSMKWKDQGYANQKGRVWLQLRRPSASSQNGFEIIEEMSIRRFGLAPHIMADVAHTDTLTDDENVVKLAKPGDYYQVMKNVGGGGGHRLEIRNFKLTIHFKPYFQQVSNSITLADLPDLVLLNVAKQLPNDDARNLSMTCKRIKGILPTYKYPMFIEGPDINERRGSNHGHFTPEEYFKCPNLGAKVEKIVVKMKWKDQGWGNRKGQVWLQLRRPSTTSQKASVIIAEMASDRFGKAPHNLTEITETLDHEENVVKLAKPGDYYQVMKNIGGGGGHELNIENFKLMIYFEPYFEQRE